VLGVACWRFAEEVYKVDHLSHFLRLQINSIRQHSNEKKDLFLSALTTHTRFSVIIKMPSIRSVVAASAVFLSLFGTSDARVAKFTHPKDVAELPRWVKEILVKNALLAGSALDKRQQADITCFNDTLLLEFAAVPAFTPLCSTILGIPAVTTSVTVSSG
jgi:hypothetical protein